MTGAESLVLPEMDRPHEECGVIAVYLRTDIELPDGMRPEHIAYDGLKQLQHRGQDAAGIAVMDNGTGRLMVAKGLGKIPQALENGNKLKDLPEGNIAIGHTRYGTMKKLPEAHRWRAAQPINEFCRSGSFAIAQNGDIANDLEVCEANGYRRENFVSDTEMIAQLMRDIVDDDRGVEEALLAVTNQLQGAYSIVVASDDKIIGLRDPNGFRPLILGEIGDGMGWVMASEQAALDKSGAKFVREIEPGEMVIIEGNELASYPPEEKLKKQQRLCAFEIIYLSRTDSHYSGENGDAIRERQGEELARQNSGIAADLVICAPNSGLPASVGFSRESGIPWGQGLVKNEGSDRTFITPGQEAREAKVRDKLNPNRAIINGKRLIVVDDSIIRGTTTKTMIKMLREAGAAEIHMMIASSPYRWPCFFGMDTRDRSKLKAFEAEIKLLEQGIEPNEENIVEWMRNYIGADSLSYLSLPALERAAGAAGRGLCMACMDGDYPVEIPARLL